MTWLLAFLGCCTIITETFGQTFATSPTTTAEGPSCSCLPCTGTPGFFNIHTQNHFCKAAAVVLGRVTAVERVREAQGIWNSVEHREHSPYNTNAHYLIIIRVMSVFNQQDGLIVVGEKMNIRYAIRDDCPMCETLIQDFRVGEWYEDLVIEVRNRYVFYLPLVSNKFSSKVEGIMDQCSIVWRYIKRDNIVPGYVPLAKRDILTLTSCDKCRVSGCFQNQCVKANEVEECSLGGYEIMMNFNDQSCTMENGICTYDNETDSCVWLTVLEDGESDLLSNHCVD